ncbi:MAG TPA: carboxypeptidase-like regulatory domain-containing protein [Bacteroidia bacterium]|nr:carboxypeptidase-like regulatory domain-containing protein [Bacteroidia bacterium]
MIQYSIAKPCHQNWNAMSPTAQGKFCAHCQKQVYDLTKEKTVTNLPANFCGRIESHKVAKEISFKKMMFRQNPFRYIAISLLLLFTKNVKAQLLNKINFSADSIPQQNIDDSITKTISISGTLIDETTKDSIPFATIIVTDSLSNILGTGVTTINGRYNFILPKAIIKGKSVSVMASHNGYQTVVIKSIPIISLKQNISIERYIGGYEVAGSMTSVSIFIDGERVTQEDVAILQEEPTSFYLHSENHQAKANSSLFFSEFDDNTPKRELIVKNNDR